MASDQVDAPTISVVVPTCSRAPSLACCLYALANQSAPPERYEILVVDDGSEDNTEAVVRQFGAALKGTARAGLDVYYCHQGRTRGAPAARNRGIRDAHARVVVFTGDDCEPSPDWVERLLAVWDEADRSTAPVGGIGGRTLPLDEEQSSLASTYSTIHRWLETPRIVEGRVHYLVSTNASYRRDVLQVIGGFDEALSSAGGEDADLGRRTHEAGFVLWYQPDAVVRRRSPASVRGLLRTAYRYGRGAARAETRHGEGRRPERALASGLLRLGLTPWRAAVYRKRVGAPLGQSLGLALLDGLIAVAAAGGRAAEAIDQAGSEDDPPAPPEVKR